MSDAEELLDDRDAAILKSSDGIPDDLADASRDELRDALDALWAAFEQYRDRTDREIQALHNRVSELDRKVGGAPYSQASSTLQKYAAMVNDGVGDSLGATDRRAAAIYLHWDHLKRPLGNGQDGVTTKRNSRKKNQPNQFRVELEQLLDEDLEWVQVYRAMKAVANLSGGEPEQDQYGRHRIVGGIYEYHERTTPDNTDSTVYKVLVET